MKGKERRTIEQSSETVSDSKSNLFGSEPEKRGKRDDGEEGEDEDECVREVGKVKRPGDGDEDHLSRNR
jgi:hypothetical protein